RDDLREPFHARAGNEPSRRIDHDRRPYGDHQRCRQADRCAGDGDRSARLGVAGHRRPGGGRRNIDRSHLSSGSRLRSHGNETVRRRRPHSASEMMNQQLTLALSKGRIFEETLPLLEAAGIRVAEDPESSRKLILQTNDANVRVIIVRASDVPTYVQYGAADFGVAGKDVLLEHGGEGLYQPIDLNIAKCRMSVAVRNGFDYASAVKQGARLRVVTKYVQTAREHFAAKGVHVDLIKLY